MGQRPRQGRMRATVYRRCETAVEPLTLFSVCAKLRLLASGGCWGIPMARPSLNGQGSNGLGPAKKPPRKRLIVCYDGTWNTADNGGNPTNVTRIARAIPPFDQDGVPQVVYYAAGVGTGLFDSVIGGVFGQGLEQNVKNSYLFLAHNYSCGDGEYEADEIYVFGFSRGAFTARSLCGFIGATKGLVLLSSLHKVAAA